MQRKRMKNYPTSLEDQEEIYYEERKTHLYN